MIQQGERLQFVSAGDETEIPFVQLDVAASGQEDSPPPGIPVVRLDGGPFIKKVQIATSGNPARIPKVRIPNLAAWFKFNVEITETGQGVSQWADMSGNGRHAKQGTDGARPPKQADGSILCNGSDEFLKTDAFTLNQPVTYYVLGKFITWTSGDDLIDGNTADSCSIRQLGSSPAFALRAGATAASNNTLALDTYGVMSAVFNGASSLLQINNGTPTTGDAGSNGMGAVTIGARGNAATFAHAQFKEVLVFNVAHDAGTRARIIRYLASVGGLSI